MKSVSRADVATATASGYAPVDINAGTLSATLDSSIRRRLATPGLPARLAARATVAYAPRLILDETFPVDSVGDPS